MSWHHGDWLSFAQAVGTVAAIFATIALFAVQQLSDGKRERRRLRDVHGTMKFITLKAVDLAEEFNVAESVFSHVGTYDQYKAFRSRQISEYRSIIEGLSPEDVSNCGLMEVSAALRVNLRDMSEIVSESHIGFATWNSSRNMMNLCRGNLTDLKVRIMRINALKS